MATLTEIVAGPHIGRPILNQTVLRQKKTSYLQIPIDTNHPKHTESLDDLRSLGLLGKNHYFGMIDAVTRKLIPGAIEELLARTSVAKRLIMANDYLKRYGLRLHLKDAFRPLKVQRHIQSFHERRVLASHSDWSQAKIEKYLRELVAQVPADENLLLSPPPHTTGGAVDVVLYDRHGEVNMVKNQDDAECMYPDYLEQKDSNSLSAGERLAKNYRRVLFWTMTEAGFAPNPTEWWHYSYGDQLWALVTDQPQAIYGYAGR